jgi:plasmid maintenance system antidote protein VapI
MLTVRSMLLRELLQTYGITSIAALRERLGLTKQYAWLLWHGKIGLSAEMIERLHQELGLAYETLHQVKRERPPQRRGRKPRQTDEPRRDA